MTRFIYVTSFCVLVLAIVSWWFDHATLKWDDENAPPSLTPEEIESLKKEQFPWLNAESRRLYADLYQITSQDEVARQLQTKNIWANYARIWEGECAPLDGLNASKVDELLLWTFRFRYNMFHHVERYSELSERRMIDFIYHSEAIEGGTLRWDQVAAILAKSVLEGAASVPDMESAMRHATAIETLYDSHQNAPNNPWTFTDRFILELHTKFFPSLHPKDSKATTFRQPEFRQDNVKVGFSKVLMPEALEVPSLMRSLNEWMKNCSSELSNAATNRSVLFFRFGYQYPSLDELKQDDHHAVPSLVMPIVYAANFHQKFVRIHPFMDGNGRIVRLLMNDLLTKAQYPPIIIPVEDRSVYFESLQECSTDLGCDLFYNYILDRVFESLKYYATELANHFPMKK